MSKRRHYAEFIHHKAHEEHKGSEDKAANALPKHRHVEVHQIAEPKLRQAEIGNDLRLMQARERLDRLHLDDDAVLYEEVQPIAGVKTPALIDDGER